jgi:hypothetical protein
MEASDHGAAHKGRTYDRTVPGVKSIEKPLHRRAVPHMRKTLDATPGNHKELAGIRNMLGRKGLEPLAVEPSGRESNLHDRTILAIFRLRW